MQTALDSMFQSLGSIFAFVFLGSFVGSDCRSHDIKNYIFASDNPLDLVIINSCLVIDLLTLDLGS